MDSLHITGLQVKTHIGIHAWEQKIKQILLIDVTLPLDCSQCEEDINKTINYDLLCKTVTEYVENTHFQLIETVANNVAQLIKDNHAITQVNVAVSKPHAIKNAKDIRVIVSR